MGEVVSVRRLLALLGDHAGLGIDVGSRFRLTHLGLFGFAVMSCATLRELFGIAMRNFSLTMLNIDMKLFEGAQSCLLELNDDHLPADVRGFFLERDVASITTTVSEFAFPLVASYADQVTAEVVLDRGVLAPLLELLFSREHRVRVRAQPVARAEGNARRAAPASRQPHIVGVYRSVRRLDAAQRTAPRHHCGRSLQAVSRTRPLPALPDVAAELDVHPRTLRRRCQSAWATPTPRRSATPSSAGTACRPAGIHGPSLPVGAVRPSVLQVRGWWPRPRQERPRRSRRSHASAPVRCAARWERLRR
jgi:Arabinose-binding domain of AraC transcription regulator, N-term